MIFFRTSLLSGILRWCRFILYLPCSVLKSALFLLVGMLLEIKIWVLGELIATTGQSMGYQALSGDTARKYIHINISTHTHTYVCTYVHMHTYFIYHEFIPIAPILIILREFFLAFLYVTCPQLELSTTSSHLLICSIIHLKSVQNCLYKPLQNKPTKK